MFYFTGEMDSFELQTNGVDALFTRGEVDLAEAVIQVTDLTRIDLSTRWSQCCFHVQRIRACNDAWVQVNHRKLH